MKIRWLYIIVLGVVLVLLGGCKSDSRYFPQELPQTDVEIVRFDSVVLAIDTAQIEQSVRQLFADYPVFMPYYVENILGIQPDDTAYLVQALPQFLADTVYGFRATNERVRTTFANIDDVRKPMNEAFARLRTLYPDLALPTVYFFVSGFNASILFVGETDIAVGVDMYLGRDYAYYNNVVYEYQKQTMRKECIPADVVSAYLFHHIPFTSKKSRLLENMLYRGKVMYLLSLLFPDESEAEIMGYTEEQMKWCKTNEAAIWNLMMDRKAIFQLDHRIQTAYLNDGPFCSEISQECPARIATWIGWHICKSYMNSHPERTLQELLAEGDAQMILEQSLYKP